MPTRAEVRRHTHHRQLARKVRFNVSPEATEQESTTMANTTEIEPTSREVAPGGLIISANVRTDTQVDKTFVSSIKQHGVLVPIIVEEFGDDLIVVDGQRRTLAAIEAGLATVPVVVRPSQAGEADRIIQQLVINDHRAQVTDAEHTAAYGQLALIGISADQIARKTNLPKKRIELAVAVSQSTLAGKAMVDHELTLDQAAVVLEFEDQAADVVELTEAVKGGQFDHVASQIRTRRRTEILLADARAALAKEGIPVWEGEICGHSDVKDQARRIDYLYADEKAQKNYTTLNAKTHADCPFRAVSLDTGLRWKGNDREVYVSKTDVCTDWHAAGHLERSTSSSSGRPVAGTPEADAASAQRKLTIANNKLWMPATEVRITFIKELLQRKEAPSDWEQFVARHYATAYQAAEHREQVKTLLGIGSESIETWLKTNPTKAPQLLIGMVFSFTENSQEFAKSGWRSLRAKAHLQQLSTWGYTLSDIEERVVQVTATQAAS
jgi:ParB family chromosome partitioning protein